MHERWGFIYPPARCHSRAMETVWNTSKLKPCCYRPRALWRADHRLRLTSAPCARVLERCTANSKCAFDNNREAEQSVLQGSYARRPWPRGGCADASPRDHKLLFISLIYCYCLPVGFNSLTKEYWTVHIKGSDDQQTECRVCSLCAALSKQQVESFGKG